MNVSELPYEKVNNYFRSVIFNQDALGRENTRFQVVKVPPGKTVLPHYHRERTEVFVLLGGEGKIFINDEVAANKLHDIALCKPNDVHAVENTGSEDVLVGVFALGYRLQDSHLQEES